MDAGTVVRVVTSIVWEERERETRRGDCGFEPGLRRGYRCEAGTHRRRVGGAVAVASPPGISLLLASCLPSGDVLIGP
jgi:hypothetical protein